jgi:insulysin
VQVCFKFVRFLRWNLSSFANFGLIRCSGAYPICPGTPGVFGCQIRLTEEGLKNYKEIVKVLFQYVSLLRETPPQEWIFEEQKGLADVDFKFKQKSPASRFTSKISAVMQTPLPREWLLSGYSR